MKITLSGICGAAAGAIITVALAGAAIAQGGPPAGAQDNTPGYQGMGNDQNTGGPAGATKPVETPILYVTGIEVIHSALEPKIDIVRVTGLASSQGWSGPQLIPFFYGKPADDVIDLQFIGSPPEQSQKAEGFVPMAATFTLDASHPFKGVRVRAAGNALTLKAMNGSVQAQIKTDDCKECVGKKFVEKGKGQPAAGTVRGEDLPPDYRPIGPNHGVKGMVHNPNRINLILDDGDKIVMAFWE